MRRKQDEMVVTKGTIYNIYKWTSFAARLMYLSPFLYHLNMWYLDTHTGQIL